MALVSFFSRLIIGGIFLTAGLAKISDPVNFLLTLRKFDLFPEIAARFLSVFLPLLEFVSGLFIMLGVMYKAGSLLLAFRNVLFAAAILSVILRGMEIVCGCFGLLGDVLNLPDKADMKAVIRNVIFTGICMTIFFSKKTVLSLEGYISKKLDA